MLSIDATVGHSTALFEIRKTFLSGFIYGIVGENGCGKSTLLRTLAGEINALNGTVEIEGIDTTSVEAAGLVAYIASPNFYVDLSVGEHLKLLEKTARLPYNETVEEWQLQELVDLSPSRLSSGQQQRFYLAAQLGAGSLRVLLIDEPERHLDEFWEGKLCQILREKASQGLAVVLATHSQRVLDLCDEKIHLS